ncbi:MAG: ATP-binding cassette domain-containing protein [Ignavibacteriaceae bacterium]|nr:ATP-binding cassette domain-containing protein [Ignavibacteriaceae bacterium]
MIELENISLALTGRTILDDVSLFIEKGTTSVILGPSGAGKSTILKVILGLLKPDKGSVIIEGRNIVDENGNDALDVRRKIGMVFQANALFDSLTVEQNAAYFLKESRNKTPREINTIVEEVLSFVNLSGTNKLYPDQLSGGMKKRLAIARALAVDPKIILFDEPTTGLDPINTKAVLNLIKSLKSRGTTSVIVTHILNDAIAIGDVLTVINDGKVTASGNLKDILNTKDQFIKDFFYEVFEDASFFVNNKKE